MLNVKQIPCSASYCVKSKQLRQIRSKWKSQVSSSGSLSSDQPNKEENHSSDTLWITHTHIHMHKHTHSLTLTHTHSLTHSHTHTHTLTHTHTYTHTHTHTHTHTRISRHQTCWENFIYTLNHSSFHFHIQKLSSYIHTGMNLCTLHNSQLSNIRKNHITNAPTETLWAQGGTGTCLRMALEWYSCHWRMTTVIRLWL